MIKVYTAIGECIIEQQEGYFHPVIHTKQREFELSVSEFQIWSKAAQNIISHHELKKCFELTAFCGDDEDKIFYETVNRLEHRGLLVAAEGLTVTDAYYTLIQELYVIPIKYPFAMRIRDFLIQTFQLGLPMRVTKNILFHRQFTTASQRLILKLIENKSMSTVDIIAYAEQHFAVDGRHDEQISVKNTYPIKAAVSMSIILLCRKGAVRFEKA